MTSSVYAPSRNFTARVTRRLTPYFSREMLDVNLERPLVTFTFDDCPLSAIEEGAKRLEQKGWRSTIYVASGMFAVTNHHGKMASASDIQAAHQNGHEIGGHSFSHIDMSNVPVETILDEIDKNQAELVSHSIPRPRSFAFPFGETTPSLKEILGTKFEALRGIHPGMNVGRVDLNQVKSDPLFSSRNIDELITKIHSLKANPSWMTFFTHDVRERPSLWGCTPEDFTRVIDAVESVEAIVLPLIDAVDYLKAQI